MLGVSGSVAAYRAPELARRLAEQGAEVRAVLTEGGAKLISPLLLQAVTGAPARTSLWDEAAEAAMSHIELARWADCIVVAPATANTIARLARGEASDLLSTVCLAGTAPLAGGAGDEPQHVEQCRLRGRTAPRIAPPRSDAGRTRLRRAGMRRCGGRGA